MCDPSFLSKRTKVRNAHGIEFLELGNSSIMEQCKSVVMLLSRSEESLITVTYHEYIQYYICGDSNMDSVKYFPAHRVWGQYEEKFPKLSKALLQVFKSPYSSAGVDRTQKITKNVLSQRRGSFNDRKIERQTATNFTENFLRCARANSKILYHFFALMIVLNLLHLLLKTTRLILNSSWR